jgi:hypothetical protein
MADLPHPPTAVPPEPAVGHPPGALLSLPGSPSPPSAPITIPSPRLPHFHKPNSWAEQGKLYDAYIAGMVGNATAAIEVAPAAMPSRTETPSSHDDFDRSEPYSPGAQQQQQSPQQRWFRFVVGVPAAADGAGDDQLAHTSLLSGSGSPATTKPDGESLPPQLEHCASPTAITQPALPAAQGAMQAEQLQTGQPRWQPLTVKVTPAHHTKAVSAPATPLSALVTLPPGAVLSARISMESHHSRSTGAGPQSSGQGAAVARRHRPVTSVLSRSLLMGGSQAPSKQVEGEEVVAREHRVSVGQQQLGAELSPGRFTGATEEGAVDMFPCLGGGGGRDHRDLQDTDAGSTTAAGCTVPAKPCGSAQQVHVHQADPESAFPPPPPSPPLTAHHHSSTCSRSPALSASPHIRTQPQPPLPALRTAFGFHLPAWGESMGEQGTEGSGPHSTSAGSEGGSAAQATALSPAVDHGSTGDSELPEPLNLAGQQAGEPVQAVARADDDGPGLGLPIVLVSLGFEDTAPSFAEALK